ncbi:MAG: TOTE conflict system archaeo-eukaryotic primase domain-containing protein [Synechococcaceae cyanobacterium]
MRWPSNIRGRSGHAPACPIAWRPWICGKHRGACQDTSHWEHLPRSDRAINGQLAGIHTIGPCPLQANGRCYLLTVAFDEQDSRQNTRAVLRSCRELAGAAALEICRCGEGSRMPSQHSSGRNAAAAAQRSCAEHLHTERSDGIERWWPGCREASADMDRWQRVAALALWLNPAALAQADAVP